MEQKTTSPIRAVVFDMDGTIFDTEKIYFHAYRQALEGQGLSLEEDFYHQNLAGTTNEHIEAFFVKQHGDQLNRARYREQWPEHLHQYIEQHGLPFMPEIPQLIEALHEKQIPLAVASSSDHAEIGYFLAKSGVSKFFTVLAAGDEVQNSKPAPDIFLLAAKRLGIPACACLVIEDSNHGVQAASDAGMRVIMTPGPAGATQQSKLLADLPDSVFQATLKYFP